MQNNNQLEIKIGTAQAESNNGKQTRRGTLQLLRVGAAVKLLQSVRYGSYSDNYTGYRSRS
jgi:hypothetical protein